MARVSLLSARRSTRLAASLGAAFVCGVGGPGCALFLSWDDYTEGGGPGSTSGLPDGSAGLDVATGDGFVASDGKPPGDGGGPDVYDSGIVQGSCTGLCEPAAPSGWAGPFELFQGASPPSCADLPDAYSGNAGIVAPPAACSVCTCAAPTGESCGTPCLQACSDGNCNNPITGDTCVLISTVCRPIDTNANSLAIVLSGPGGGCAASDAAPPAQPAVTWDAAVSTCAPSAASGTCGTAGTTCFATPPAPYLGTLCVTQAGVVGCPAQFPTQYVAYEGFTDGRGCGGCSCGNPGGSCAVDPAVQVNFFFQAQCQTNDETDPLTPSCLQGPTGDQSMNATANPIVKLTAGTCPAGGGAPTGSATPTGPTTFCCFP